MRQRLEWNYENVAREAWLAVGTRPGRSGLVWTTLLILLGAIFGLEAQATASALTQADRLEAAGRYVYRVRPAGPMSEPLLPRYSCDALVRFDQITAAGGLIDLGSVDLATAPRTPLRAFEASGSFAAILDESLNTVPPTQALIARGAAGMTGYVKGDLTLADGWQISSRMFNPGQRHPSSDLMVLFPTSAPFVQECWFMVRPGTGQATARSVALLLETDAGLPVVGSILQESPTSVDPLTSYSERPSRFAWLMGGIIGGLLLALVTLRDREQIALARVLGASYLQSVAMGLVQLLVLNLWALISSVLGTTLIAGIQVGSIPFRHGLIAASAAAMSASGIGIATRCVVARESASRLLRRRGE